MNSRERVFATVAGEAVDRRAFFLNLSLYGARLTNCPLRHYYADATAYADGQTAVREAFQPDLLISPFVFTALGEAFGSRVRYLEEQAPNLVEPAALTVQSFLDLAVPDLDANPRLLYIREAIRLLASRFKGEVPIVGALPAPMDLAPLVMGVEAWLEVLLFDEEGARRILDRCTEFCIRWGNALLADGATLLALTADFSNSTLVPERVLPGLTLPALANTTGGLKAPVILHGGGCRLGHQLSQFKRLPNVLGFALDSRDSLAEARAALGPGHVLLGNLDGPNLHRCSPVEVEELCRRILEDRAEDPRFILASSCADLALATPVETIQAVVESVRTFLQVSR